METDPLLTGPRTNDSTKRYLDDAEPHSLSKQHHHEEFEADLDALLDGEALTMAMPLWQKVAIGVVFAGSFVLISTIMIGSMITDSPIQRMTLAVLAWLEVRTMRSCSRAMR